MSQNQLLAELLATAKTRQEWLRLLATALGRFRSLVIKHYADGTSTTTEDDAWANGTLVWQSKLVKSLTVMDGAERSLMGYTTPTVRHPVDFSRGVMVARLLGQDGKNYHQFIVGAPGSVTDIRLSDAKGTLTIAFGPKFAIYAPPELPSEVIVPPSPVDPPPVDPDNPPVDPPAATDAGMPVRWELEHIIAGEEMPKQTIMLDTQAKTVVWEDDQLRAYNPGTPYWQSKDVFQFGDGGYAIELGIHAFQLPASHNAEKNKPVWEVLPMMTPSKDRWNNWPFADGYNAAYDSTIPRTFRLTAYHADGTVHKVFHMDRDGKWINDPTLQQTRNESGPWRPFVNIAQQLYHVSHELKLAPDALSYHGGAHPFWKRPKQGSGRITNAAIPVFGTGNQQINGFLHILYMEEWAHSTSAADFATVKKDDQNVNWNAGNDPSGNAWNGARYPLSAVGWRREFGSFNGGLDNGPGKGGIRFQNRGPSPSGLLYYLSDINGKRVHGGVPWKTMWHEYVAGCFNLPYHFVLDARTGAMPPVESAGMGKEGVWDGFYNPGKVPSDKSKWIRMHGMGTDAVWKPDDFNRDGIRPYTGWTPENQHPWETPALQTITHGSVACAVSQKLQWFMLMRSWNMYYSEPSANMANINNLEGAVEMDLFTRQMAARWNTLGWVWKTCVDDHPLFVSRAEITPIIREHLEALHDKVMLPTVDPAHSKYNHYFYEGLRNLAVPIRRVVSGDTHRYGSIDDDKRFYLHEVLTWWRTTGMFDWAKALSPKCTEVLRWLIVDIYGKMGPERFVATKGRQPVFNVTPAVPLSQPLVMPADYFAYAAAMVPQDGSDMVRNADGTPFRGTHPDWQRERQLYQHNHQQCLYNTVRHFSDYNVPYALEAVAMSDAFEAFVEADIAKGGPEYRLRLINTTPNMAPPRMKP